MENQYISLGNKLDFQKEIDQEDIDKINNIFSDKHLKGLKQAMEENNVLYKHAIVIAYEMITGNKDDFFTITAKKEYSIKEKNLIKKLYEKYQLN